MGLKVQFRCEQCLGPGEKSWGEYNRSVKTGRRLFCSRSCAAVFANGPRKAKEIVLTCPGCSQTFTTTTHNKAKRHCSRSCASKASMSDDRREAQRAGGHMKVDNLQTAAETLKQREAWKYVALREVLRDSGREFEFEYELGGRVFDLALLDTRVLVEFDGPYHQAEGQREDDAAKDQEARDAGFTLIRRMTRSARVIDPEALDGL